MPHSLRRLTSRLALAALVLAPLAFAPQAHASTVIDFEDPALTGVYFPGDTFVTAGFQWTQQFDAGTVDGPAGLIGPVPTNNTSQFYANQNDGYVTLERADHTAFSLDGFSAAFLPLPTSASTPQTIVLVALATTTGGDQFGLFFSLGDTTSTTVGSPFLTYDDPLDFGAFTDLASVDFFACALVSGSVCSAPTENNAQFALDDVTVTAAVAAVPEPSTYALMALGLFGVAAARRRAGR